MFNYEKSLVKFGFLHCKQISRSWLKLAGMELLCLQPGEQAACLLKQTVSASNTKKQFIFSYHPKQIQIIDGNTLMHSCKYIAEKNHAIDCNQKIIGKLLYLKCIMLHILIIILHILSIRLHLFCFFQKFMRIFVTL